jgi:sulfopyruvate decarboxylase TPP-binding subunit
MPMGRAVRPALDALGIPHITIERAHDAEYATRSAGMQAFELRLPVACLLPRRLTTRQTAS